MFPFSQHSAPYLFRHRPLVRLQARGLWFWLGHGLKLLRCRLRHFFRRYFVQDQWTMLLSKSDATPWSIQSGSTKILPLGIHTRLSSAPRWRRSQIIQNSTRQQNPHHPLGPLNHCLNLEDTIQHPVDIEETSAHAHGDRKRSVVTLKANDGPNGDLLPQTDQRTLEVLVEDLAGWRSQRSNSGLTMHSFIAGNRGQSRFDYNLRGQHNALTATVTGQSLIDGETL